MSDIFKNVNFEDVNLERYNDIDMRFSKEEKEDLKKKLKNRIVKRKSKRNGIAASVAILMVGLLVVSNGNSVLASVLPTFNKLYEGLGFKSEYLPQSVYIGKTYEQNGIKVTLENLVGTKHILKVALKVEYSDKWSKENRPLVHFSYDFEGKSDTDSFGVLKDINENTQLSVIDFCSEKEIPSKGNFKIEASSDGFKMPIIWYMKVDFSKLFEDTIEKQATMSNDTRIGFNIKHVEANALGTIIRSKSLSSNDVNNWIANGQYFISVKNKIYPIQGGGWSNSEMAYCFLENINYDVIKECNSMSLIRHINKEAEKSDQLNNMTKEESIKYGDEIKKQLDEMPKVELQGVSYTKEIKFNNGNKAEIYNVERADGKIRIYVKGDDKKQVFNMLLRLYPSTEVGGVGGLLQSIEDTGEGYMGEFDDIPSENITIKMDGRMLDCNGAYSEEESEIRLK